MNTLTLAGCTPEPLGNYLKALGVFRLVAEQVDPAARAWWRDGVFHLSTGSIDDIAALVTWLLGKCEFTPLVAPWQKGSGYLPMGKREKGADALRSLLVSTRPAFARFRAVFLDFAAALGVDLSKDMPAQWMEVLAQASAADGPAKSLLQHIDAGRSGDAQAHRMLRNDCRGVSVLDWLDAVGTAVPTTDDWGIRWFGLLASGGGESSGQYVVNFQQRLQEKLPLEDGVQASESRAQLTAALTGRQHAGALEENKMGAMYYPALIKGFNSGQSFSSKPDRRVNPWDFLLLLEGTVLWASAMTRRQMVSRGRASFPFFCQAALGGASTLAASEAEGSPGSPTRGELWCPLWDGAATIATLRALFGEGRLQLGDKTCDTALEFARAVSRFGVERGVSAFVRFGLLERSGSGRQRTLLAVPLGRWVPRRLPHIELLDELDPFHSSVADRLQHHDSQPKRLISARLNMERAAFEVASQPLADAQAGHRERLLHALVASATLERELGVRYGSVKVQVGQRLLDRPISPIQPLSSPWLHAADDGSVEFRLARGIASIAPWGGSPGDTAAAVGTVRSNLLPLRREDTRWAWDERSRSAVWSRGAGFFDNLAAVLRRRLIDASRAKADGLPLWAREGADFQDLLRLWQGEVDERRLDDLVHALALVDFRDPVDVAARQAGPPRPGRAIGALPDYQMDLEAACQLPRAYALLKLCFVGGRLPPRPRPIGDGAARRTGEEPFPPMAPEVLNLLMADRAAEALGVAARRLRAKGYPSIVPNSALRTREFDVTAVEARRLVGLLFIPVRRPEVLARLAIKPASQSRR